MSLSDFTDSVHKGFGYVAPSKTKTNIVDSDRDINKIVGEMN